MRQYEYCAFYDATPTVSDALRAAKSDDEIRILLTALPSQLAGHFPNGANIITSGIEERKVRGVNRLTRTISVSADLEDQDVIDRIERAFNELHLFGERMS